MNNALHPTALQRFVAWLRALYLASLCCFVLQAIGAAWRDSWCCAQLSRILGKPAACASSRAHALLAHLSARMERHSDRLAGKIHESIFYHICQAILRAGLEENPGIIPLCHGGAIISPDDARAVFRQTSAVGFIGASSIERIPVEQIVSRTVESFKSLPLDEAADPA